MFNQDRSLTVEAAEHPSAMPSGVAHDPPTASYSHLSPLCFHGLSLTNCFSHKLFALINICVAPPGCHPKNSWHSDIRPTNEPSLLYSYYCELFAVAKKAIYIGISNFWTLSGKHPGWRAYAAIAESIRTSSVGGKVGMDVWVNWKMKLKQLLGGLDRNYLLSLLAK